MKLIGVITGCYEGNNYAKIITTENVPDREGCAGLNAVVSKANYTMIAGTILPEWELYKDQEVVLAYDRFGKVQQINII